MKHSNLLGGQIRKVREKHGLSHQVLAARCSDFGWEVTPQILSRIEARQLPIRDVELLCLSKALKVSPDVFSPTRVHLPKLPRR